MTLTPPGGERQNWDVSEFRHSKKAEIGQGRLPQRLDGHVLSVLRKENGRWRLARDANFVAPVA